MARILLKVVVLSVALFCVNGQIPSFTASGGGGGSGGALESMMRRLALSGGGAGASVGAGADMSGAGGALSALGATGGLAGLATSGGLAGSAGLYGSLGGRGGRGGGGRGQMMRNLMLIQRFGLDNFVEFRMCQRIMPGRLSMAYCMQYLY